MGKDVDNTEGEEDGEEDEEEDEEEAEEEAEEESEEEIEAELAAEVEGERGQKDNVPTPAAAPLPYYTRCDSIEKSKDLYAKMPRFSEAFTKYCKDKEIQGGTYKDFQRKSSGVIGEISCAISDAHFAAAYEVTAPSPVSGPEDRLLFDHVAEVFVSIDQLMDWGPDYNFWGKQFPDVLLNESVHSSGSYHGEYYEPFLHDKWRKDRATIFFANSCPCTFIKAQQKQGALWTEDYHNADYGAFDRAKAMMKKRGIEVEIDETRSPPLAHPYIIIGTLGDNWGWLSGNIPNKYVIFDLIFHASFVKSMLAVSFASSRLVPRFLPSSLSL